ncbi:MAG: hypothetical protein HYV07_17300 [Deltaproteobacteria bacterium]|nr:hypothetical protein [Deltaproteobacteria bacterium]
MSARHTEQFEHAVLRAIGRDETTVPFLRWAQVHRALSDEYLAKHRAGFSPDDDEIGVRGVVYSARTLGVTLGLLASFPIVANGPLIELGSGLGPFAFGAAAAGFLGGIHLVDLSPRLVVLGCAVLESVGARALGHSGDARALVTPPPWLPERAAAIALPYSLLELGQGPNAAVLLAAYSSWLAEGGRIYVIEAGDLASGRELSTIREQIEKSNTLRIVGPCTHHAPCPRLEKPSDWCHFTWPMTLGPVGRRVADLARRRHSEAHFSFLVLERSAETGQRAHARDLRVLESRRSGPGKQILRVCAATGERTLVALLKHKELAEKLAAIQSGARIRLDESQVEPRGDGERLTSSSAIDALPEHA